MAGGRALNISETLLLACLGPSFSSSLPHSHPTTLSLDICPLAAGPGVSELRPVGLTRIPPAGTCRVPAWSGWQAGGLAVPARLRPSLPMPASDGCHRAVVSWSLSPSSFLFGWEGFVSTVTNSSDSRIGEGALRFRRLFPHPLVLNSGQAASQEVWHLER